mmetsp:Transcript_25012/g.62481  ORF Transcript_25012/g.62481 Transcript_25012/m.62481 type:complete len:259 (-) Transcript_25012:3769-4545(-)
MPLDDGRCTMVRNRIMLVLDRGRRPASPTSICRILPRRYLCRCRCRCLSLSSILGGDVPTPSSSRSLLVRRSLSSPERRQGIVEDLDGGEHNLLTAHGTRLFLRDGLDEGGGVAGEPARRALRPIGDAHALPAGDAERDVALTAVACQLCLWPRLVAEGARAVLLARLGLIRLAHDGLDLALVRLGDLGPELGRHELCGVLQRSPLEPRTLALDHGGGEDGHHVRRELADVLGHAGQHARRAGVVAQLHQHLDEDVGV